VLDAHCAHLGAHLGVGGTVAGDDIICPFHHWRWSCEGCTVDIPYSERTTQQKRIGTWPVREVEPFVLLCTTPPDSPRRGNRRSCSCLSHSTTTTPCGRTGRDAGKAWPCSPSC